MANILAAAGGAAEGLEGFLLNMLRQQQLEDTKRRTSEEVRSNQARETLTGRQIDESGRLREAQLGANKIAADRLQMDREAQERNRVRDDNRANLDDLLPGARISTGTRDSAVKSGAAMPERFKGVVAYDQDFTGPLPSEAGLDTVKRGDVEHYELEGTAKNTGVNNQLKTVLYKGKPVDASYDPRTKTLTYQGQDITADAQHYETPSLSFIQSGDTWGVGNRKTGDITSTDKPLGTPAATRTRQDLAERVGSHFDDIQQMIDEAEKRGLLGPLQGRTFVDFMAGKVGTTGNAQDDELLGELRQNLSLARSGLAQLHGRGGANVGIVQNLEKNMDAGHMSYNELTGALRSMKNWVNTYAVKTGSPAPAGNPTGDLYDEYLRRHGSKP